MLTPACQAIVDNDETFLNDCLPEWFSLAGTWAIHYYDDYHTTGVLPEYNCSLPIATDDEVNAWFGTHNFTDFGASSAPAYPPAQSSCCRPPGAAACPGGEAPPLLDSQLRIDVSTADAFSTCASPPPPALQTSRTRRPRSSPTTRRRTPAPPPLSLTTRWAC